MSETRVVARKPNVTLLSGENCNLCEHAQTALLQAGIEEYAYMEIDNDPQLMDRYGHRIPVLRRESDGAELSWPFDVWAIRKFLA